MTVKYLVLNQKSSGKFERVVINNRPHLLFDVVALETPSVMKRIFYPQGLVVNSIPSLVGKPAPASHPIVNGMDISASHPLAINAHNIGAFVSNARYDNGKVVAEVALDIGVAEKDERGKEVIRRIENAERIGFSTGLPFNCDSTPGEYNGEQYDYVLNKIDWDHLAILLNEQPAGKNSYNIINCNVQDVGVNINDNQNTQNEDSTMQFDLKTFVKLLIANSSNSFFPNDQARLESLDEVGLVNEMYSKSSLPKIGEDEAKALLVEKGLVVNSKNEIDEYIANSAEFKEFLTTKAKAREALVSELITNSKFDKETLDKMDDKMLVNLQESLKPVIDFSSRGGQQIINREVGNEEGFADYS